MMAMTESLPDFAKIPVKCPTCLRNSLYKIGRLRDGMQVRCPICWTAFDVDTSRIDEGICSPRQDEHDLALVDTATLKRTLGGRFSRRRQH